MHASLRCHTGCNFHQEGAGDCRPWARARAPSLPHNPGSRHLLSKLSPSPLQSIERYNRDSLHCWPDIYGTFNIAHVSEHASNTQKKDFCHWSAAGHPYASSQANTQVESNNTEGTPAKRVTRSRKTATKATTQPKGKSATTKQNNSTAAKEKIHQGSQAKKNIFKQRDDIVKEIDKEFKTRLYVVPQ